jgi:hypothetical protein
VIYITATANDRYAVELTENNCVDTSDCVDINTVGIYESTALKGIEVYPNPSSGKYNVLFNETLSDVSINILDIQGKLIQSSRYSNAESIVLNVTGKPGVYLLEVISDDKKQIIRLVKE